MVRLCSLIIVTTIALGMFFALPVLADDFTLWQYTTNGNFRVEGFHTEGPMVWPDFVVIFNDEEILEADFGGGWNWRVDDSFSVLGEVYLTWQNGGDTDIMLMVVPSYRHSLNEDWHWGFTLPFCQYLDSPDTLLIRNRVFIGQGDWSIGAILRGRVSEGALLEDHGPYVEVKNLNLFGETTTVQVGYYDGNGNNNLEARLIFYTD